MPNTTNIMAIENKHRRSLLKGCPHKCQNGGKCMNDSCECPVGFVGPACEIAAVTCPDGTTVCLQGTTCTQKQNIYRCENSIEFCKPSPPHIEYFQSMAVAAFCLNGGKCRDVVAGDDVFPTCDCTKLYEGPHCEFLKLKYSNSMRNKSDEQSERRPGLILWIILLLGIAIVISLFALRQVRRLRQRRRQFARTTNLQGFRDGGIDHNEVFSGDGLFWDPLQRKSFLNRSFFSRNRSDSFKHPTGILRHSESTKPLVAGLGSDYMHRIKRAFSSDEINKTNANRRGRGILVRADSFGEIGPDGNIPTNPANNRSFRGNRTAPKRTSGRFRSKRRTYDKEATTTFSQGYPPARRGVQRNYSDDSIGGRIGSFSLQGRQNQGLQRTDSTKDVFAEIRLV